MHKQNQLSVLEHAKSWSEPVKLLCRCGSAHNGRWQSVTQCTELPHFPQHAHEHIAVKHDKPAVSGKPNNGN
jgi:hypothetical protein